MHAATTPATRDLRRYAPRHVPYGHGTRFEFSTHGADAVRGHPHKLGMSVGLRGCHAHFGIYERGTLPSLDCGNELYPLWIRSEKPI